MTGERQSAETALSLLPTFEVGQVVGELQPGRRRHDWCSIHGDLDPMESIDGHARKAHGASAEDIERARETLRAAVPASTESTGALDREALARVMCARHLHRADPYCETAEVEADEIAADYAALGAASGGVPAALDVPTLETALATAGWTPPPDDAVFGRYADPGEQHRSKVATVAAEYARLARSASEPGA